MTGSSWYRRSLWNYKGNREYTKSGYESAAARFVEQDLDVDCSDRHYMITGANSGIGLQTASDIAKKGGIIHMVCRNQEAATKARSEIITTTGNDKIHLHIVDLAKPREVVSWAQRFAAQHERLHALIHNAGCMVHERRVDEDGVETNFAVNTLAVHIITLTLMKLLQRSEDARVILVSSAGMLCVRLEPHDLMHASMEPFDGRLVYSQNKRQQVVMGLWYAQRFNNVHFSSMHPGWADTPAVRSSLPQFYEMMKDNLRTPAQGADTVVWLAVSKAAVKHPSGLFYQDREPVSSHLPLAWTKSTIEEEDFLMTNIQDIYTKIYNRMFPQAPDAQDTSGTTPNARQAPAPPPQTEAPATPQASTEGGNKDLAENEEAKVSESEMETSLTENPPKPEPQPTAIPVLPPPPAPASKVTPSKSEVQEVAEIHAPPATLQEKTETTEEKKTDVSEEKEIPELKAEIPETKTEKAEEKTNPPEEQKTDTPAEDSGSSAQGKEEERTEESQKDEEKGDEASPAPSSDPAQPEP